MIINIDNNVLILSLINILSFGLGYLIGKLRPISGVSSNSQVYNGSPINRLDGQNKLKISIDDSKFVTEIKTDGLEKKYTDLGDKKVSNENIGNSINKLKNMKG